MENFNLGCFFRLTVAEPAAVAASSLQRSFDHFGLQGTQDVVRMHPDQKAAPPAVDVDQRQIEDGLLDIHRHRLLGAKGAGTADQKTGVAVGDFRLARFDLLAADLPCQFLG